MARPILAPSGQFARLVRDTTPYDLGIAVAALIGGIISASEKQPWPAAALIVLASVVFLLTALKLFTVWQAKEAQGGPQRLESSLYALHTILTNDVPETKDPKLRITLHIPAGDSGQLEQVVDYVGNDRAGRTAGRRFPVNAGIIGLAYRQREAAVETRQSKDTEQYVAELVRDWGYTEEQARQRDMSAMAWMAIPLVSGDDGRRVDGVVYLDAVDPKFFTPVRQNLALCACIGIARYVRRAYTT